MALQVQGPPGLRLGVTGLVWGFRAEFGRLMVFQMGRDLLIFWDLLHQGPQVGGLNQVSFWGEVTPDLGGGGFPSTPPGLTGTYRGM